MNAQPQDGRRKEAALNDIRILDAALTVFIADPDATIASVAREAGVGIGAVYRRFENKEGLLQRLCLEGLNRYIAVAEAAAQISDPWSALCHLMRGVVAANTHALTIRIAGTFPPTEEMYELARVGQDLNVRIFKRAKWKRVVRADVEVDDLNLIFEQLATISVGDKERNSELRQRYLQLFLDGLCAVDAEKLPASPPNWEEISGRWTPG